MSAQRGGRGFFIAPPLSALSPSCEVLISCPVRNISNFVHSSPSALHSELYRICTPNMPPSTETYSEATTIETIRSYYDFLTKLYLPAGAIKEPPPTGWPGINPQAFSPLGKTEAVISLLAHLPYVSKDDCEFQDVEDIQCAGHCCFVDWRIQASLLADSVPPLEDAPGVMGIKQSIGLTTEGLGWEIVPSHIVGLTDGGRDKPVWLLDTKRGVVYWLEALSELVEYHEEHGHEPVKVRDGDEAFDFAADAQMWTIKDFFEMLKEEFRALRMVPISDCRVLDVYTEYIDEVDKVPAVQQVFREHNWPQQIESFDKGQCLAAVRRLIKDRFPDEVDEEEEDDA